MSAEDLQVVGLKNLGSPIWRESFPCHCICWAIQAARPSPRRASRATTWPRGPRWLGALVRGRGLSKIENGMPFRCDALMTVTSATLHHADAQPPAVSCLRTLEVTDCAMADDERRRPARGSWALRVNVLVFPIDA